MAKLDYHTQYIKRLSLKREEIPSFHTFPYNLPVMQTLDALTFHPNVTYLIGENGMGKSTLLEGIAVALGFNPEGGTRNNNFSSYDSHSELHHYLRVAKGFIRPKDGYFFRAETFYNVATNIEDLDKGPGPKIIDGYGGTSLHKQSHGEAFFAAFTNRFRGNGIYILDEPEAALSPLRQMSMLTRIHDLVNEGSQFIISTHSPIIMAYDDAKILELTVDGMQETVLEETGHYRMMKQFFTDKDRMLHHLFQ
ncbi:AAA family ATPase [Lentibacillus sp. N15]|uniref:AAA family ATPase n=1 Tax=Lentibacillus songyuanensis TaxID=3136161 RepID=UPI0031BA6F4E